MYRTANGVFYVVAKSGEKITIPEECYNIFNGTNYIEKENITSLDLRGLDTSNTENVEVIMDSIGFTNLETVYCTDQNITGISQNIYGKYD